MSTIVHFRMSGADAATAPDASIALKSGNVALNSIIQNAPQVLTIKPNASAQRTGDYRYCHRYYA